METRRERRDVKYKKKPIKLIKTKKAESGKSSLYLPGTILVNKSTNHVKFVDVMENEFSDAVKKAAEEVIWGGGITELIKESHIKQHNSNETVSSLNNYLEELRLKNINVFNPKKWSTIMRLPTIWRNVMHQRNYYYHSELFRPQDHFDTIKSIRQPHQFDLDFTIAAKAINYEQPGYGQGKDVYRNSDSWGDYGLPVFSL